MIWQPEIEELKYRQELAAQMGGKENIERQHKRGKLTVRERIDKLADPGSFQEIGGLAGTGTYEDGQLVEFRPSPLVIGICTVNGRKVVLNGGDFTLHGGAAGSGGRGKTTYAIKLALEWQLPYIRLIDAAGGSVMEIEQAGRVHPVENYTAPEAASMLETAPVISAVMGSAGGWPAVEACLAHFSIMLKDTSQLFAGGPPVVKVALWQDIIKEELGGERVHARQSGVINNVAETEEEAFDMVKRFLSYLPDNVWQMPPRVEPTDDPNRRDDELLSIIPRAKNKLYDPYDILNRILDRDSLFEIAPLYGQSRITALARVNGYPVGVMINNPNYLGGTTDVAAGEKVIRLMQLCDTFHLPIVCLVDEPGFMIGLDSEKQGIVRAGALLSFATVKTRMPWITFVIRQLYGVAGALHFRPGGMYQRYAWITVNWGTMHIEGGTEAAYRREIETAEDPEAKRQEIGRRIENLCSPFRTAEAFGVEHLIDPRETRPILCDFVETAQSVLQTQLGPTAGLTYRP